MMRKRQIDRAGTAGPLEAENGNDSQDAPLYDRPSKSQLKRDMLALQVLGKELAELPKEAFRKLPLPEDLFDALTDVRKITDHEGRRRQMQFVGKVMRRLTEEEVDALRKALDVIKGLSRTETLKLHMIERWRDQLVESDQALTDFLQRYPGVDVQVGRNLIRNARREAAAKGSPRYYRELFQWVKTAVVPATGRAGSAGSASGAGSNEHDDEDDHDDTGAHHPSDDHDD